MGKAWIPVDVMLARSERRQLLDTARNRLLALAKNNSSLTIDATTAQVLTDMAAAEEAAGGSGTMVGRGSIDDDGIPCVECTRDVTFDPDVVIGANGAFHGACWESVRFNR